MQLTTKTKGVEDLERLETEINTEAFEAFYHIGQKLLRIKTERLYESAGFKSWSQYCASGRIDYQKSQADRYIRASELRPKLGYSGTHDWSVKEVLELTKCETDNDAKRVAKKAIAIAEKTGERVTAKLIAQVRDGIDETGAALEKQKKQLQSASLENHLTDLADLLVDWRKTLEALDLIHWESVPSRILTRVRRESEALTIFLKG
jgi:bacterioferritin (cytochrome b1)